MEQNVIIQKRVYISGQHRVEVADPHPTSNWRESILQTVISEDQVKVNYNFNKKPYEFFPELHSDLKSSRHINGSGLRKMFPFVDNDYNVECIVTLIVSRKDVCCIEENYVVDEYKQDKELYNFHTESTFFIVDTGHDIMMSKDSNDLFWETDNGNVKWGSGNCGNSAILWNDHPLYDMFPEPADTDEHGEYIPYEAKIIVDACI